MSFFATGTWVAIGVGASVAAGAASTAMAYSGAQQQKGMARASAKYNAALDIAKAKQMDLDTTANIKNQRAEDKVYMSQQQTAYAMAGVLSSGSPLAVAATTAGRLEQRIQNEWQGSVREEEMQYSAAKMGVQYGESQARAYDTQAVGDIMSGGAHLLSTATKYGMYKDNQPA